MNYRALLLTIFLLLYGFDCAMFGASIILYPKTPEGMWNLLLAFMMLITCLAYAWPSKKTPDALEQHVRETVSRALNNPRNY